MRREANNENIEEEDERYSSTNDNSVNDLMKNTQGTVVRRHSFGTTRNSIDDSVTYDKNSASSATLYRRKNN